MRITQAMFIAVCLSSLLTLGSCLLAQEISGDRDTTPHSVQFVAVDDNIKLEVLDWGGSGRPMILLHGGNGTAHDFDKFALKLTGSYHVYGITRRGAGRSSAPPPTDANYSADRLGDDVLAVIDDLGLDRPVLVGHSLAGQELSSVGSRYPERVAGLVYLEAAYQYAYYDRSKGFLDIEVNEVRRKLEQLEPGKRPPDPRPLLAELLQTNLPELERTLRQIQESFKNAPPQPQAPAQPRPPVPPLVGAMNRGSERYTDIRVPVLALYAFEAVRGPDGSPARAASEARNQMKRDQAAAFEAGVPSARVVRLDNASHDVFRSNESDVLREINDFVNNLPKPGDSSKP
jgi:pimeloyl-ACP methyl ester carboxylesterase